MNKIKSISAREIIDSRANPTVEATVALEDGSVGIASVPSGASTGIFEATELRDGDDKRYNGKGVLRAVHNVNVEISNLLVGKAFSCPRELDNAMIELDNTENKKNLGANATLSVSLAIYKALAISHKMPLYKYIGGEFAHRMPVPLMNILNGGVHASNNIDIQEFMIAPSGFNTFAEALQAGCEVYSSLGKLLKKAGHTISVGDEGGFAPDLKDESEAIEMIIYAIEKAGYSTNEIKIALDIASSEWYKKETYHLPKAKIDISSSQLIDKWAELISKYPIISIEDPLGEIDYDGWGKITQKLGKSVMLVGDDLFVTNKKRLDFGIKNKIANTILIKPNQIGTLTETLDVIRLAKENGYYSILSHRSGDTDDTSIADISVGVMAEFIKTGAPCRMERACKYNRLLKIEDELFRGK